MPKRDYKSYNILEEELENEEYTNIEAVKEEAEIVMETNNGDKTGEFEQEKQNISILDKLSGDVSIQSHEDKFQSDYAEVNHEPEAVSEEKTEEGILADKENADKDNIDKEKEADEQKQPDKQEQEIHSKEKAAKINLDKDGKQLGPEEESLKSEEAVLKKAEVDMSFSGYKNYYQTKERSRLAKWSIRLVKVIITIMLLPFISILALGVVTFLGGFIATIFGSVAAGFIVLGSVCFMASQLNASLVALGVSAAITAFSFGGILLILFCMLMKWVIGLLKKGKTSDKKIMKKEVR